ncbi:4'-phosphopantetheinyl transferase family protein [Sphingomonas sp.]|uniref:4'-phosphopantetheinyl transferase family protein n=1 Tax=Sphingomonas sp. TaxID=28214 RepID=UPI002E32D597|nr:4'-phosphopantetheinyl transferase superfamily protein [Sphingomonas sp.]HEX4694089.1 4'-phosphopantetheinyl transferase superfamily protein [Sphingomonas sp.]
MTLTIDLSQTNEVVLVELEVAPAALANFHATLDSGERECASRFRFARDRDRYIARRGQLRALLAERTGERTAALRIAADAYGKPFLVDRPKLHFSLSHSHGRALFAFGCEAIGCDLEWRNPELACRSVAARLFAPAEVAALDALPAEQWVAGFYNCWTRKEAFVKAIGLGLSYPLDAFEVSVDKAARFVTGAAGWSLVSFEPAPGFQAALVTRLPEGATAG